VAVERAGAQFTAGDHTAALSRLEAFSPSHRLIARTRAELAAQLERERLAAWRWSSSAPALHTGQGRRGGRQGHLHW
jgi:hypothetical protein